MLFFLLTRPSRDLPMIFWATQENWSSWSWNHWNRWADWNAQHLICVTVVLRGPVIMGFIDRKKFNKHYGLKGESWAEHRRENKELPYVRSCNRWRTKLASRMWSSCLVGDCPDHWVKALILQKGMPNFWVDPCETAIENICSLVITSAC